MGDKQWTDETALLVARVIHDDECTPGEPDWDDVRQARLVLAALADAGLLLPPGSETKEEWAVRVDEPHPLRSEKAGDFLVLPGGEAVARLGPRVWSGWVPVRRTHHIGPWQEVPDEH
jgi:hypothetical protein